MKQKEKKMYEIKKDFSLLMVQGETTEIFNEMGKAGAYLDEKFMENDERFVGAVASDFPAGEKYDFSEYDEDTINTLVEIEYIEKVDE